MSDQTMTVATAGTDPIPWDQRISLTLAETARLIGTSERTLQRMVAAGTFPVPYRRLGRRRVFAVAELKVWLDGRGAEEGVA